MCDLDLRINKHSNDQTALDTTLESSYLANQKSNIFPEGKNTLDLYTPTDIDVHRHYVHFLIRQDVHGRRSDALVGPIYLDLFYNHVLGF